MKIVIGGFMGGEVKVRGSAGGRRKLRVTLRR